MGFTIEQVEMLNAKLDKKHVQPAKQFGPKGDYIEGWHAIAEANRIFGFDRWSYDISDLRVVNEGPREIGRDKKPGHGVTYVARVRVVVDGVSRDDVGAGHGYDVDLGLAHESAIKEAVTDALKRSLRSFGNPFGLALYDKTRENVESVPAPKPVVAPISEKPPASVDKSLWETAYARAGGGTASYQSFWLNDTTKDERATLAPFHEALKARATTMNSHPAIAAINAAFPAQAAE